MRKEGGKELGGVPLKTGRSSPKNPSEWLIKRVIALEGDQIKSSGCFEESVNIPRGHCWVEGDNRLCSLDSNNFGPVPTGLITAKATRVLWPPDRWGRLEKREVGADRVTERENVDRGRVFFGWE
ncbi:mitochondrial inner membrane protease subunit 2 [Plakobranchus ocellatus]|uniref:Mitochondrial inner membrane protease subunit 2 n=1 Tax=Plakobranchus ocellatus TaxID=259542 RepID=A0AAV4DIW2_9GAST|nr:mitochondrial inner membrane protease subunit 2 [Plakobranchus ocellatus]